LIGITSSKLFSTEYLIQIHTIKQKDIKVFKEQLIKYREIGFSGAIIRVFQNRDDSYHYISPILNKKGVYFSNNERTPTISPIINKLTSDYNIPDFKTIVWMSTRRMDWVNGKRFGKYLILQNKQNQKNILSYFKSLANFKIAGILIQDDLVIKKKEENFLGVKNKKEIILQYLQNIKKIIGKKELITNIYYEVPYNSAIGDSWYGQNMDDFFNVGVDSVAIMLYQKQIQRELKLNDTKLYQYINKIINNLKPYAEKTYIKLQITDFKTGKFIKIDRLLKIINLIPDNFKGIIFTPVRTDKFTYLYLKSLIGRIKK